ncbi:MAG: diguanylate cyclase domain-containing protein, partial [Gammaproteobacteria bacterium]
METVRQKIYDLHLEHPSSGSEKIMTASIGISSIENANFSQPWDLSEAADYALYQAKHAGHNRIFYVPSKE